MEKNTRTSSHAERRRLSCRSFFIGIAAVSADLSKTLRALAKRRGRARRTRVLGSGVARLEPHPSREGGPWCVRGIYKRDEHAAAIRRAFCGGVKCGYPRVGVLKYGYPRVFTKMRRISPGLVVSCPFQSAGAPEICRISPGFGPISLKYGLDIPGFGPQPPRYGQLGRLASQGGLRMRTRTSCALHGRRVCVALDVARASCVCVARRRACRACASRLCIITRDARALRVRRAYVTHTPPPLGYSRLH